MHIANLVLLLVACPGTECPEATSPSSGAGATGSVSTGGTTPASTTPTTATGATATGSTATSPSTTGGTGSGTTDTGGPPNTPPTVGDVDIAPANCHLSATAADNLTCIIAGADPDPDGDPVTYAFRWEVDGADAGVGIPTVRADQTEAGQTWTCIVTPFDGRDWGEPVSESVVIHGCAALELDGGGDGFQVDALANVDLGAELTLEAWVLWDGAAGSTWHVVGSQGAGDAPVDGGWWVGIAGEDAEACGVVAAPGSLAAQVVGGPCAVSGAAVPEGRWVHVAAVLDSGRWRLFVDGLEDEAHRDDALVTVSVDAPFYAGTAPGASGAWGYRGVIDEVRLLDDAIYEGEAHPPTSFDPEPGTVALYNLDEGKGTTVPDSSGNGRDGLLLGGAWTTESTCDISEGGGGKGPPP